MENFKEMVIEKLKLFKIDEATSIEYFLNKDFVNSLKRIK